MKKTSKKMLGLKRRHFRVRRKVTGSAERPRISVYRSATNIYVQLIDDDKGVTIVSVSTQSKGSDKSGKKVSSNIESAKKLGTRLSEVAKEKKIQKVVFDRGGYRYHGKIKALAEAARAGGLQF